MAEHFVLLPGWDADDLELVDTGHRERTSTSARAGAEFAPKALSGIYAPVHAVYPGMLDSGIIGNAAHNSGYHRSRNELLRRGKRSDSSIQLPRDKQGNGNAVAAIDIGWSTRAEIIRSTTRLIHALQTNDPRMGCIREVLGTLDGHRVTGYSDHKSSTGRPGYITGAASHLTHNHLSAYRGSCEDPALTVGVVSVITGKPLEPVPYPAPTGTDVYQSKLIPGQKDSDSVWWLQTALAKLGFYKTTPSGEYGSATVAAVAAFQNSISEPAGVITPAQTVQLFQVAGVTVVMHP